MTSPTAPTIDANGIHAPQFSDILAYLQTQYRSIYGADVYLGNDSQDGQFLGIVASAINDANAATVAAYNSFSPATAQGNGLSNNIKINGIARNVATASTVNVTITGVAGTTITNGMVADSNNNQWNLPASVVIPSGGSIIVTATCTALGAITAAIGTVTSIQTPTYGWQSVTNASAASVGAPVETDAALRVRQGQSVALPSSTILSGILGAVEKCAGVTQAVIYENDSASTDGNGLPAHSIAAVVQGGAALDIANAISNKKTPGAYTYGTTSQQVVDSIGIAHTIRYFVPTAVPISVGITVHALTGYTSAIGVQIQQAVAAYINALPIGQSVFLTRLYVPAQLSGGSGSGAYEVTVLQISAKPAALGNADVTVAFNQNATCAVSDVVLTVV